MVLVKWEICSGSKGLEIRKAITSFCNSTPYPMARAYNKTMAQSTPPNCTELFTRTRTTRSKPHCCGPRAWCVCVSRSMFVPLQKVHLKLPLLSAWANRVSSFYSCHPITRLGWGIYIKAWTSLNRWWLKYQGVISLARACPCGLTQLV